MPTGFTAAIKDGISFKTFAMNCARAFGACITLRDEDGGGEKIPEVFEPSDYHLNKMREAQSRLASLQQMSSDDCAKAAVAAHAEAESDRLRRLDETQKLMAAYQDMLEKVLAWSPPTKDHVNFHNFMSKQIFDSMKFDCDLEYYSEPTIELTGEQWLQKEIGEAFNSLTYHQVEYRNEVERAADRTAWVKALRDSLP